MATVIPSNSAIDALLRDDRNPAALARIRQLEEDQRRRDEENRQTVNTDRGPVRE